MSVPIMINDRCVMTNYDCVICICTFVFAVISFFVTSL